MRSGSSSVGGGAASSPWTEVWSAEKEATRYSAAKQRMKKADRKVKVARRRGDSQAVTERLVAARDEARERFKRLENKYRGMPIESEAERWCDGAMRIADDAGNAMRAAKAALRRARGKEEKRRAREAHRRTVLVLNQVRRETTIAFDWMVLAGRAGPPNETPMEMVLSPGVDGEAGPRSQEAETGMRRSR